MFTFTGWKTLSFVFKHCLFIFQDKLGSWFSNPGTGTIETGVGGGGVGKYLKTREPQAKSNIAPDTDLDTVSVTKKRKLGVKAQELKDFSAW